VIRHRRADHHRDRKCMATEDTKDEDFKIKQEIRHNNPDHDMKCELQYTKRQ